MFSHRSPRIATILATLFVCLAALTGQTQRSPSPLNAMEHGLFVSSTIATDPLSTRSIFVYKGVAVKVGKDKDAVFVFDTDLIRPARTWTRGFLKWYPARDGLQEWPSPDGFTHFSTGERPGWSTDGRFGDPRLWRYGPLPKSLGVYKGLYINEELVVSSYQIGGVSANGPIPGRASTAPAGRSIPLCITAKPRPTKLPWTLLKSPMTAKPQPWKSLPCGKIWPKSL